MADAELHGFQCPNCGAKLHPDPPGIEIRDPRTGKLVATVPDGQLILFVS
ncbi:MAG TPA: hypothetical protein VGF94_17230 [Kofleriaceae bacterium]|jgi:hypothetical protein